MALAWPSWSPRALRASRATATWRPWRVSRCRWRWPAFWVRRFRSWQIRGGRGWRCATWRSMPSRVLRSSPRSSPSAVSASMAAWFTACWRGGRTWPSTPNGHRRGRDCSASSRPAIAALQASATGDGRLVSGCRCSCSWHCLRRSWRLPRLPSLQPPPRKTINLGQKISPESPACQTPTSVPTTT